MNSNAFFANKRRSNAPSAERVAKGLLTEDQLGEMIRDACAQLGWHFLWLRKTINSSDGILDLTLVPIRLLKIPNGARDDFSEERTILHRELKGHDARGRLYKPTPAQLETIQLINDAGGNAGVWEPADWFSGKILAELR